jgi:hypothetical protein
MGINFLEKFFPAKTTITSATIKAEIDYSESEIARLNAEISPKLAAIATMTDPEHVKAEADIAVSKRAIKRLDMRIARLQSELPKVEETEAAFRAAAKDEALRNRAEACRKANAKEAKVLLASYTEHANVIAETVAKLKAITDETTAVNIALSRNPVADSVVHYDTLHRKHPGREATGSGSFQPGRYEDSLETAVRLPPAFVGTYIFPRS